MAKRREDIPYDENDAKLLAQAQAPEAPVPASTANSLSSAMSALWEKAPAAPAPAETKPAQEEKPQGVTMEDAFKELWSAVGQKQEAPRPRVLPQPAYQPSYFPPVEKDVLPENAEQKPYKELGGEHVRKALWSGVKPEPEEMCTLTLCSECRKPMWTRIARENICEECFLAIHTRLEMDMKANHVKGFTPGSGIVNPLR